MATITIPTKELKTAVKESVREVLNQELMKFRALLLPSASQKEQKDIEKRYGKPIRQKFKGENINLNIKKLKGEWEGFYRIRFGKLRIIAEFQFEYCRVYIDKIDRRGNVYK